MAREKKQEAGFLNAHNALTVAQVGSNFVPGGNLVQGGLDMASASLEFDDCMKQIPELMGDDVRSLKAGSPALKNYIKKELPEIYGDRAMSFGFSLAGVRWRLVLRRCL